jgi:hypothetical protein
MSPPAIPERTIATATGPRRGNSRTPPPHLTFPTPHPPQPLHPSHPPSPPRGQHLARPQYDGNYPLGGNNSVAFRPVSFRRAGIFRGKGELRDHWLAARHRLARQHWLAAQPGGAALVQPLGPWNQVAIMYPSSCQHARNASQSPESLAIAHVSTTSRISSRSASMPRTITPQRGPRRRNAQQTASGRMRGGRRGEDGGMSGRVLDPRYVRGFQAGAELDVDWTAWPAQVPAVAQVLRDGFELPAGLRARDRDAADGGTRRPSALAVLPARGHHAPGIQLPGRQPRPQP